MALWNEGRHRGRMRVEDIARSSDTSLNLLVVALLIAVVTFGWWTYGRMGPAGEIAAPPSMTRIAPAPTVNTMPTAPDATTKPAQPQSATP